MSIPEQVRQEIRRVLWGLADEVGWGDLPDGAKAKLYEQWTHTEIVGGRLSRYIDKGQVRVYIKDSLIKPYMRARLSDPSRIFRVAKVPSNTKVTKLYTKPHGCLLADKRILCWGRAADWKGILLAAFERAYGIRGARVDAVVFLKALGRYSEHATRDMIETAATELKVGHVFWLQL